MGMTSRTSAEQESRARETTVRSFLDSVAAALPTAGFWTMPALVAVSGGADSMALFEALRRLVPAGLERRLIVAHAEHDLRDSSAADREFVVDMAGRSGITAVWRRLRVRDDHGGEGEEGRARRLRYEFLAETACDHGCRHVVVAHTADDQAETILQRMLRGSGLAGIGGMAAARELVPGISLLRPMLSVRRPEVRRFLEAIGSPWRDDPTNDDRRYARNFLRHEVLAPCAAGPFPAATESLARLGRQAAVVAAAIRSAAEHLLESHSSRHADGSIVMRTRDLAGLDRHLVAEVFVALWRRERWPLRDMTARHYAGLADLVRDAGSMSSTREEAMLPGGVRATRSADGLLVVTAGSPAVRSQVDRSTRL
jgi:tRNA(Ile)-lysidine synthase